MTQTATQNNSTLGARYIRAKDLKRVYGISARALSGISGAPKPARLSHKMVVYSIADLDFWFRRYSGRGLRGTSLGAVPTKVRDGSSLNKKSGSEISPNGSSLTASGIDTQDNSEKTKE